MMGLNLETLSQRTSSYNYANGKIDEIVEREQEIPVSERGKNPSSRRGIRCGMGWHPASAGSNANAAIARARSFVSSQVCCNRPNGDCDREN